MVCVVSLGFPWCSSQRLVGLGDEDNLPFDWGGNWTRLVQFKENFRVITALLRECCGMITLNLNDGPACYALRFSKRKSSQNEKRLTRRPAFLNAFSAIC